MSDIRKNIEGGIEDFFIHGDLEEVKNYLVEHDLEINENRNLQFIKKVSFLAYARIQQEIDQQRMLLAKQFIQSIKERIDKPIEILKGLIQNKELSLQFRNLDDLSEEDIRDILIDSDLISIIEKLEDGEDQG